MMMAPFSDAAFTTCRAVSISPRVRRITGADAGGQGRPAGLATYIVGHGRVAVIDPGPASLPLLAAILEATGSETITHVALTHGHGRRSPIAAQLAERSGAEILSAERGLADGRRACGPDWTLEAMATPGHTRDHFAFALVEEDALFCGDLVSGRSPQAMAPGADLAELRRSIETVRRLRFTTLMPAHGPVITEPDAFLQEALAGEDAFAHRIDALSAFQAAAFAHHRSFAPLEAAMSQAGVRP
jgi:glyoxylase-like metal-dependent hydrolase (beta-lactamase superfamily II)